MHIRIRWGRLVGAMGAALVVSTIASAGSTPAYAHGASAKSSATAKDPQQEQREIAKFEADISRLEHDLSALPPEVNSLRMYAGPGSGPMAEAASAWNGLAAELGTAAQTYAEITTGLAHDSWSGSSSSTIAASAGPYVAWMQATAQQAEQAAAQAKAEAAAFEQSQKVTALNG